VLNDLRLCGSTINNILNRRPTAFNAYLSVILANDTVAITAFRAVESPCEAFHVQSSSKFFAAKLLYELVHARTRMILKVWVLSPPDVVVVVFGDLKMWPWV
jgi:hypothetical protein